MPKKLFGKRGESLTEALVSVLIIVVSAAMLATMISVAVSINMRANAATADLYDQLSAAETGSVVTPGTATIDSATVNVDYYGRSDGLTAYAKAGGSP